MYIAKQHEREGFTLIEIMVAILIVGIMAAVGIVGVNRYLADARTTNVASNLRTFKSAITYYQTKMGTYPSSLRDLVRPPADEKARKRWGDQPFLDKEEVPEDPWGNAFVYRLTPGGARPYELYSKGVDGADTKESRISVWDI